MATAPTHYIAQIFDATAIGQALVKAASAGAARTTLGVGTTGIVDFDTLQINSIASGAFISEPSIDGASLTGTQTLGVLSLGGAALYDLRINDTETLTAHRVLTIITGDSSRTLTLSGNATISGTNTGDMTLGTGVATALAINTGSAGAVQLNNGSGAALTALTAANITASTTAGRAILNVTNPSAISFVKIAADNTVSTRTPAQVLSDIGAQASGSYAASGANSDITSASALTTAGAAGITTNFPGPVTMTKGTASTTPATGTLIVTGGIGSSNRICASGDVLSGTAFKLGNDTAGYSAQFAYDGSSNTYLDAAGATWHFRLSGEKLTIATSGTAVAVTGTFSVSSTSAFTGATTHTGGIVGTVAGGNATAGNVGQTIGSLVAVGSAVALTVSTTVYNVSSISLTAGDWWVQGQVSYTETVATASARSAGVGTTSATLPTDGSEGNCGVQSTLTTEVNMIALAWKRINVSSTTTVYLCAAATFSAGTVSAYGALVALRASR